MRLRTYLLPAVLALAVAGVFAVPSAQAATTAELSTLLQVNGGAGNFAEFNDVAPLSATGIWAVQNVSGQENTDTVRHWNGTRWSTIPGPGAPAGGIDPTLQQVVPQAAASGAAWFLGADLYGPQLDSQFFVAHYGAGTWTMHAFPTTWIIRHLAVVGPTDVWALGSLDTDGKQSGVYAHLNGTTWTTGSLPAVPQQEGGSRSPATIYAVAADPKTFAPRLLRLRGSSWVLAPLPTITLPKGDRSVLLSDVVQDAPASMYLSVGFAGDEGLGVGLQVFHWNGSAWTLVASRVNDAPAGMTSDGHGGVWVVNSGLTEQTYLLHINLAGITQNVEIPSAQPGGHLQLNGIALVPGTSDLLVPGQIISSDGSNVEAVIDSYAS